MNLQETLVTDKDFTILKSLFRNERNEISMAKRNSDGQTVILKQSVLQNENISRASRLAHEYEILKQLDHPGIPKVLDILYDGKMVTLVQEFIDGTDFKSIDFKRGLTFSDILDIAIQLSEILHYLHQKGFIHKDITPRNIMLAKNGVLNLLDFGISSNLHSESSEILNVDQIEGTLTYISPEQTGRTAYAVTQSCDFYSFGIFLYELLAGKPPFDSVDPLEVIHFHLSRNPIQLKSIVPGLPDGLEKVVAKLMEKNPDDRYHNALGLKADLITIKEHYLSKKNLENFTPGLNDITEQYKQSQKLYGREHEIEELLGYYKNLNRNQSMLVLVAGYSGVGKSALIRHIKFPIIQNNGTFLSGKFDQFKKDIPYYGFIEAIREFIKNLLSEPEDKIKYWRERILNVLGENAGLITEVIPQLSKVIGKQPPVPVLQPAEQESRFQMVILDFIYVFSTFDNPLVIFLDDLQWADLPSLSLMLRILQNPKQDNILILGAYRDNEVEKGHPLLITLKQIKEFNGQLKEIKLQPLNLQTTCKITADSFGMNETRANELGEHIFTKTKGNPFFIHSFLKSLYDKKLVTKEPGKDWVWDSRKIDKLDYTENVIDLMTEGLTNFPGQTQLVMKFAAVLGNTFSLTDLADITEKTKTSVFMDLVPAIKGGYISSNSNRYREIALSAISDDVNSDLQLSDSKVKFTFSHDKVQQAAYNLIPDSELAALHLKIGRLLLQNRNELQIQEDLFELVNHFILSYQLVENEEEKTRIAELCLTAGKKAKDSTSYNLAVTFLKVAKNLLGKFSWTDNYELTYNVLKELGECEYLNDNPEDAEKYFNEIYSYARSNYDKLKVYYIHTSLYLKIGDSQKSLAIGLKAVKLYNIRFPKNKKLIEIAALVTLLKYLVLFSTKYKKPEDFTHIKDSSDEEYIALGKLLIDLASSAYMHDQNLMMLVVLRIIGIYLKKGYSDASGWGFSGLSVVVLSALKMQAKGFDLWKLTLELNKKTQTPLIKWRLNYTASAFGNPWRIPFRDDFENILNTIKACVINGDQVFTGYAVSLYQRYRFIAGVNLHDLIESSEEHIPLIQNAMGGFDFFQCFHQMEKGINGRTKNNTWDDESFDGADSLKRIQEEGNMTKLGFFHTARLVSLYYFDQHNEVIEENKNVLKYKGNFLGELCEALHAFYTALSISAVYHNLDKKEKKSQLKDFKAHFGNIKFWSKCIPSNYEQHYCLLQAELYAIENKFDKAIEFYEQAIQLAEKNKFGYVKAISSERAAVLCESRNLKKQTEIYLQSAWNEYKNWGAVIKCNQLENNYREVFSPDILKGEQNLSALSASTTTSSRNALDLASVVKASQTIASQVKYQDVLKNLMHITIENAGAERGCLLLYKGDRLCIEAVGISGKEGIEILPSVPFEETDMVPNTVINYCRRTEESVVVNEAKTEERFNKDPYIQKNQSLSVLCIPIAAVGKMKGMLYLENNLLKGVFSNERIELLQMLSGQIGISIENSILYENLEEKVQERTREIERTLTELKSTQSQLIQAEKMASLGELTAGIAHEIQNPLNFVNNFSEVSNELIIEMKEEMETGNLQIAAEIAEDIRQNLEKINHHGKRASGIVKGMLEHSRTGTGEKILTDINQLTDEYLRLAYHGLKAKDNSFNVNFKTEFDENLPKIKVVPQDIGRVLLNLINNAFYAVQAPHKAPLPPEGGFKKIPNDHKPTVIVKTSYLPPSGEMKGAETRGAIISVIDNGPGIPDSIKDKIFQPFFTTKPTGQGTGLGLSLSYDIVKAHGGTLEVKSQTKGETGTEFIVKIPISNHVNH